MPSLSKLLIACVAAYASAAAPSAASTALGVKDATVLAAHAEAEAHIEKVTQDKNFDILQSLMSGDHKSAIQSLKDLVLYKQSVLGKTVCNNKVHKMFSTNCKDADENSPPWFIQFCQEMKDWRREHPDDPCLPCEPGSHAGKDAHLPGHAGCHQEYGSGSGEGSGELPPSPPPPSPPLPPHPPKECVPGDGTNVVGWEYCPGACIYPAGGAYRRCAFSSEAGGPANEDECLMLAASVTGVMGAEMERVNTSHICHIFLPWDTLCYEVGLGRKTVGYHSSGCKNCLEYRYSPPGFRGKHCKHDVPPSPPPAPSHPLNDFTGGTDWMCSWPPCIEKQEESQAALA